MSWSRHMITYTTKPLISTSPPKNTRGWTGSRPRGGVNCPHWEQCDSEAWLPLRGFPDRLLYWQRGKDRVWLLLNVLHGRLNIAHSVFRSFVKEAITRLSGQTVKVLNKLATSSDLKGCLKVLKKSSVDLGLLMWLWQLKSTTNVNLHVARF